MLQKSGIGIAVLSYQDLAPDFPVQPLGAITLKDASAARAEAA